MYAQVFDFYKKLGDDVMSHYFSQDQNNTKSNPKAIAFRVHNVELSVLTDHGVFAKDGLDRGTKVLLEHLSLEKGKTVLDLGCGYGSVGLFVSKKFGCLVDYVDINERALDLTKQNLVKNKVEGRVFQSDGLDNVTATYDYIITNPPIRAGKKVIYRFFKDARNHLTKNGEFYVVINKKHGADSALKKLQTIYQQVEIIGKDKGFYVIKSKN